MVGSLDGKRALILGAGGGMGAAVANALMARGMHCALTGRTVSRLEAVDGLEQSKTSFAAALDLSDTGTLARKTSGIVERLGGLDVLVHCAGLHVSARADVADLATWDAMLDANFRGFVHVARHALPHICAEPGGAVVAIGSILSYYAGGAMAAASKQALTAFCRTLFEDVREHGTKVSLIHPGYVATPMVRVSDGLDRTQMIQPDDIARTVSFVLDMPQTVCPTEITLRPQRTPYRSG